jgi:hypothetical protein
MQCHFWVIANMMTNFQAPYRNRRRVVTPAASYLLMVGLLALSTACSSTQLLSTKQVNFRCDSKFNDGLLLPVDIVYIPEGEKLDTITGVSPDEWFDSQVRADWPYIQSLSFRESEVRNTVEVILKKAKQTVGMVVIADYRGLNDTKAQMIVFNAEESKENEDIFITINGLLH